MTKYDVNPRKYEYLEPLWPVLENHPEGISLKKAVERSGLDEKMMLKQIEQLAIAWGNATRKHFNKGFIQSLVQKSLENDKPDETWIKEILNTWLCDKVMLYNRIKELNCEDRLIDLETWYRLKELWLETKGM